MAVQWVCIDETDTEQGLGRDRAGTGLGPSRDGAEIEQRLSRDWAGAGLGPSRDEAGAEQRLSRDRAGAGQGPSRDGAGAEQRLSRGRPETGQRLRETSHSIMSANGPVVTAQPFSDRVIAQCPSSYCIDSSVQLLSSHCVVTVRSV